MDQRLKLGFLASNNGSSARGIVNAIRGGELAADASLLVSNNRKAPALDWAANLGLPALAIPTQADPDAADARLAEEMAAHGVDLIVMSGYLRKLGPATLRRYRGRILNIHPGPLPAFGGHGMYGRRVHEAVIAAKAPESGVCIHLVDEEYDRGPVIARRSVPVEPGDTAETLEARVTGVEPEFFVATLRRIASGELALPDASVNG
ncbi:phosphoribosylglycinamide formyltransferase [Phenylobacterium sp. J367]|uniref:phosphoribosylglycinamide formyltransferase n=1 Tax=Phenylobacterium sp. J367 TaxID=2898435 RepID=UPI002150F389|nr:phosphoribosylglycinamide formyltransferase [Phenylobacterium sp. J367]MCR5880416.1 phosphoribosylglycinamide formyltransferase [Phenylobacterium sp. J367]